MELTPRQRRTAALAALLGNALEWYDFAVYGYLATDLGRAFFPADVPVLQTLASFGVFAVGYLMRPIGSLVLGPLGDLLGRRLMLSFSIVIMGFSSLLIGLLPTHAQIGISAGFLLVLLRMLQGFSVGGEFTGSITYASEASAQGHAGRLSSLATAGGLVGFSLGSLTAAVIGWNLGAAAMASWGWRLPFLLGAGVAGIGFWMRRRMPETMPPDQEAATITNLSELFGAMAWRLQQVALHWRLLLQVIALVSFANVIYYLAFVFLVNDTGQQMGQAAAVNSVATVLQTLGLPIVVLGGHLADRYGLVPVNRWGNLALLLVMPLAQALALLLLPLMATMGAQGVLGVVMVPLHQRCTIFSIGYSLAMALFAGTAPLVATWLLDVQHWSWGPPLYGSLFGIAALWAVQAARRTIAQES